MPARFSVLMVCMGNICRSPTAEGVFRHLLGQAGLQGHVQVDSAGTLDYHVGTPPDARSCAHARRRGYDLSDLRARQVSAADYERFNLILAMDWRNLRALREDCRPEHLHKIRRLMEFAPAGCRQEVVDPYYGRGEAFEAVLDDVELACRSLLLHVHLALQQMA